MINSRLYLCSGFAIGATLLRNWIAQMAKPEHRWQSRNTDEECKVRRKYGGSKREDDETV